MRFFRSLLSALFSLTLVAGLLPAASVFAATDVPSWGDPSIMYGTPFFSAEGNFTQSGVTFGDFRPVELDRWQVEFKDYQTGQVTNASDKYDVFDLQKVLPSDNFETKNGYGLLPLLASDKLNTFIKMANGNPTFVTALLSKIADNYIASPIVGQSVFYKVKQSPNSEPSWYVRSAMLVTFSGGRLDHVENTPTDPFDPGQPNGTANFLTSPWPKINQAVVQGDSVHVDFTTYGLNPLHHPTAKITNGTDEITQDFGEVNKDGSHDTYNGVWDVPLDQVKKLGSLDKLTVVVWDGYGRTAQAPLGQNLAITYNWAADYTVPYTAGQPASFTQALVLTRTSGTTPDPADKFQGDTLQWSYSVDGGPWQPLTVLPDVSKVFDASGNLKQRIVIDTNTLNSIPGRQWGGGTHKIQVKVSASPGDQGQYLFTSEDSGGPGSEAVVTVTFTEAGRITAPIKTQMGNGLLNIMWPNSHPDPSAPAGRALGGLPDQVKPCGTFVAPIEITNTSESRTITTTVDFVLDGTIVIKRTFESKGDGPPPPPQYMSFPLHGVATKTFTIAPKWHVYWDVGYGEDRNISYTIEGYEGPTVGPGYHDEVLCSFIQLPETTEEGPIGPLVGPLDVGMPATKSSNSYDPLPHYAVHIQAIPRDPEDYFHSPIDEWVGVTDPSGHARVRLVQ